MKYYQELLDIGFVANGKVGIKIRLTKNNKSVLYCEPCKHLVYNGKVYKFGTLADVLINLLKKDL